MYKVRGYFQTLYQREEPHTPVLPLATHVNPAKVNDEIPSEVEMEEAVRRLCPHRAGVNTHLRAWHFNHWQQEAYPQGSVKDPPTEGALDVPGRHGTAYGAHGGDTSGAWMDGPGPNSKGDR